MPTEALANPVIATTVAIAGASSGAVALLGVINSGLAIAATTVSIVVGFFVIKVQLAKLKALRSDERRNKKRRKKNE